MVSELVMTAKRKPTSKQALYSSISCHAKEVVERLVELSKSKNENVALGACKTLLNKTLPDVKSVEVTQSSVLDNLILKENDRFKPAKTDSELTLENMTEEQKKAQAQRFIAMGEAMLGIGRYGEIELTLGQNLANQSL